MRIFLPGLIGQFVKGIMDAVKQALPSARFEVLYPPDVNNTALAFQIDQSFRVIHSLGNLRIWPVSRLGELHGWRAT